jgi:cytidine deaminase
MTPDSGCANSPASARRGSHVVTPADLIAIASQLAKRFKPSDDCTAGDVGAALVTTAGHVYTGICIDTACSLGFCAEHAAIAEMLKARESEIRLIVAIDSTGAIGPPCGRCRELMWQVDPRNRATEVIIDPNETVTLDRLLPRR